MDGSVNVLKGHPKPQTARTKESKPQSLHSPESEVLNPSPDILIFKSETLPVINIWVSPNLSPLQVSCLKFWRFFCSKTSHPREASLSVTHFPLALAWLSQTMQCKLWVVWKILGVGLWGHPDLQWLALLHSNLGIGF